MEKEPVIVTIEGRESASEKNAFGGRKQYTIYVIRATLDTSPPNELAYFRARFSEIEKLRDDLSKTWGDLPSCGKGALGGAVMDVERRERKVVEFLEVLFSWPKIRGCSIVQEFLGLIEVPHDEEGGQREEANGGSSPPPSRPPRPRGPGGGVTPGGNNGGVGGGGASAPPTALRGAGLGPNSPAPPTPKRKGSFTELNLFGSSPQPPSYLSPSPSPSPSPSSSPSSSSPSTCSQEETRILTRPLLSSSQIDKQVDNQKGRETQNPKDFLTGAVPVFPGVLPISELGMGGDKAKTANAPLLTEEEKIQLTRFRIASELLTTEESYINNLKLIINNFLNPLKDQPGIPLVPSHFSQIEVLLGVNEELLRELKSRLADWTPLTKIGDAMALLAPYLKMYSSYAMKYQVALEDYQKLLNDSKFAKAHAKCQATIESHLNFESLVIQPIQRIPRYNLLLRDLLARTPEDHPDYHDLSEALLKIEQVALTLNEHVRQEEKSRSLHNISTSISGLPDLVVPHRHLLREGEVTNIKLDKKQLLLLFNDKMVIANRTGFLSKKKYEAELMWDLDLTWIGPLDQQELAIAHKVTSGFTFGDKEKFEDSFFRLTTPEGTYLFGATGTKERNGWISDIQKASSVAGSEKPIREGSHVYRSKVERYDGKFSHGTRDVSGGFHYFDGSVYVGGWEGNREDGPAMLLHKGEGVSGREEKEEEKEEGEGDGGEEGGGGRAKMASHVFLLCSGEFRGGVMKGWGSLSFATGDVYEGDLESGEMHGKGTMKWSCGSCFEGEWINGGMSKGKLTSADGKHIYDGSFENGRRHGEGTMHYRLGGKYVGHWVYDFKEGSGEYHDAEGSIFKGMWAKGKKVNGCMQYVTGDVFEGEFKGDAREGKGVMKYFNGSVYSGEWVGGRRQGRGVLTFKDGSNYRGLFDNDYATGHGVLHTCGGTKYEGTWKDGRLEGRSVNITSPSGVMFSGYVKENRVFSSNSPYRDRTCNLRVLIKAIL